MFTLRLAIALGALLPASVAWAIPLPPAPCASSQFGCGGGPSNVVLTALKGDGGIASVMLQVAAGLAVLYIIWSGFQMVISMGDEGKLTQHKWGIAYALIGLSVAILSQFAVSVVGTQNYGQLGGSGPLYIVVLAQAASILRTLLNAVFLLILILIGLKMLYAQGKADEFNTAKKMLTWALVGAVLVNLSAALVIAVGSFFAVN